MNNAELYTYAQGDLLNSPNTYQYSQFMGEPFLKGWKAYRTSLLSALGNPEPPPAAKGRFSSSKILPYPLASHLEDLMDGIDRGLANSDPDLKRLLKTWVKKFEISKRIHEAYDAQFKPVDKTAFHDLSAYLRFAEIMEGAYSSSGDLVYLNVFLKVLDTLISVMDYLASAQTARLCWLIQQEMKHVEHLAEKKGVVL